MVARLSLDESIVTEENQDEHEAIQEANARLIAAAPDLLAALEELADCEQKYRSAHDLRGDGSKEAGRAWDLMRRAGDRARAAIAKAKGEAE